MKEFALAKPHCCAQQKQLGVRNFSGAFLVAEKKQWLLTTISISVIFIGSMADKEAFSGYFFAMDIMRFDFDCQTDQ